MPALPFVNRTKEIKYFVNDALSLRDENKVIFLHAPSGLGKSRLSHELGVRISRDFVVANVEISQSRAALHQDGYYIRMAGKAVDAASKHDSRVISFEKYIKERIDSSRVKRTLNGLLSDLVKSNKFTKLAYSAYNNWKQTSEIDVSILFDSSLPESILQITDYLRFVSSANTFFISIQNAQNMDVTSVNLFPEIFSDSKSNYVVLEYTDRVQNPWNMVDLMQEFKVSSLNIEAIKLIRLKVEDVLQIVSDTPSALEAFVRKAYVDSEGSLRPLTDIDVTIRRNDWNKINEVISNNEADLNEFTLNSITALDSSDKILLSIFAIHGEIIEKDCLSVIVSKHFSEFSEDWIIDPIHRAERLCELHMLRKHDSNSYKIHDDTICDLLGNGDEYTREQLIAARALKSFYSEVVNASSEFLVPKTEAIYFLVYLNLKEDNEVEAFKHLEHLFFLAKNSLSPSRLITHAIRIKGNIYRGANPKLRLAVELRLVEVLENLGFSDDALAMLNDISGDIQQKKLIMLYKALLLEENSEPDKALAIAQSVIDSAEDIINGSTRLVGELIEFSCLRSKNRYNDAKELFYKILENEENHNYFEYGYVLRAAGSALSGNDAIPYLHDSVDFFKKRGAHLQEAHSRIELGVALASTGQTKDAKNQFLDADKLLHYEISERHTVMNNLACIIIMEKGQYEEAFELLRTALVTARTPFDRLAIHINTFLAAHLAGKDEFALKLINVINEICQQDKPADKEIRRIAYHNIAAFLLLSGDSNQARNYLDRKIIMPPPKGNDYLVKIDADFYANGGNDALGSKVYYPCFMAHWHMELENLFERL